MSEVVGQLAEALGRLVGWLTRRTTVTTGIELLAATAGIVGVAGISRDLALIALSAMLFLFSWRMNHNPEE